MIGAVNQEHRYLSSSSNAPNPTVKYPCNSTRCQFCYTYCTANSVVYSVYRRVPYVLYFDGIRSPFGHAQNHGNFIEIKEFQF